MSRRPPGTTVMELLIASALLLALTAVLFGTLVPVMRRSETIDAKQDNLQRTIVLREYLNRRLRAGYVITGQVQDTSIPFYQPDTVLTSVGEVQRVDSAEMPAWDESRVWEIAFEDGKVVDQVRGTRANRKVLWDLGTSGSVRFIPDGLPLLQVEVRTLKGQVDEKAGPWERRIPVVLEHYAKG